MKSFLSLGLFIFASIIALPALAAPGFKYGNNRQIDPVYGAVNVQCQSPFGMGTQMYNCNTWATVPNSVDVFIAGPVNADHVKLIATHANGGQTMKTVKYNSKTGQSGSINLLIQSLFQQPLLGMGKNVIHYALTKGSKVISKGQFTSVVTQGANFSCPFETLFESNCTDANFACDQYFQEFGSQCTQSLGRHP